MKKHLLSLSLAASLGLAAQNQRTSLFEEFTGETCPPCAATNPGLDALLKSGNNLTKMIPIKWQVPIPSAPTPTWSLYKTDQAEIDWRAFSYGYGINSAPSCRIDGQDPTTVFSMGSDHPGYMSNAVINNCSSVTTPFSINLAVSDWDPAYSVLTVTVNIAAAGSFNAIGNLLCRVVLIENEIHFATAPGTNGEKDFNWIVRKSYPTIQNGTAMSSAWTNGQTQSFVLTCTMPSYIQQKSQVAFVAFIQDDGDKKIWQAAKADARMPQDAKALSISLNPVVCGTAVTPTAQILNNGTNAITSFTVVPSFDGIAGAAVNWTGNLAVGASTAVVFNAATLSNGSHTYSVNITGINGGNGDMNPYNNSTLQTFVAAASTQTQQVAEGFANPQFPPANWARYNPLNGSEKWVRVINTGAQSSSESAKVDFFNISAGTIMDLVLPPMNFSGNQTPQMTFDVAYARYDNTTNDRLEVLVSTNCGTTWTSVYNKQGVPLSTRPDNTSAFTPSDDSQWRNETVALTGYTNSPSVLIKFRATSDFGNNLYLDNVNLMQAADPTTVTGIGTVAADLGAIELFPNPSKGITTLRVVAGTSSHGKVSVMNALGQEVYSKAVTFEAGENTITINAADFANGMYQVVIDSNLEKQSKKFIIQH